MRIHNRHDIAQACASEPTKYSFDCVHVLDLKGEPHAVATDGKILAIVPAELNGTDERGAYPAVAFSLARQQFLEGINDEFPDDMGPDLSHPMCCYGVGLWGNGKAEVGSIDVRANRLDFDQPFTLDRVEAVTEQASRPACTISINIELLVRLAAAIGSRKAVTLEIRANDKPIVVRPCLASVHNKAVGYLMPIAAEGGAS